MSFLRNRRFGIALLPILTAGAISCNDPPKPPITPPLNKPPTLSIIEAPQPTIDYNNVRLKWEGKDEDGTIEEYSYELSKILPGGTGRVLKQGNTIETSLFFPSLEEGSYAFYIRATDNEGERSREERTTFTIDLPNNVSSNFQRSMTYKGEALFTRENLENIVKIEVVDNNTNQPVDDVLVTYLQRDSSPDLIKASDPEGRYWPEFLSLDTARKPLFDPNDPLSLKEKLATMKLDLVDGSLFTLIDDLKEREATLHPIPNLPRIATITASELELYYQEYDSLFRAADAISFGTDLADKLGISIPTPLDMVFKLNESRIKVITSNDFVASLFDKVHEILGTTERFDTDAWYMDIYYDPDSGILYHKTNTRERLATLKGGVTNLENGNSISEALVDSNNLGLLTTTREDGSYTLTHLLEGTFDITASKEGYEPQTKTTTLRVSDLPHFTPNLLDFELKPGFNHPPNPPSNPDPSNLETEVPINMVLRWSASDPDRDPLTYDVFFEANDSSPDEKVAENLSVSSLSRSNLNEGITYYWQVTARDKFGKSNTGPVWEFTTTSNHPPNPPSTPFPGDWALNIPTSVMLRWSASDPDRDPLTYDVFFEAGDSTPDNKIASNITVTEKSVLSLLEGATYYWQVIAKDTRGASTSGPVWRFNTRPRQNQPPDTWFTSSLPSEFQQGLDDEITWTGSDPDGSVDGYERKLDNENWVYTTSRSFNVKDLQPGQHTFQVRSRDNRVTYDPSPATFTFTIEGTSFPSESDLVILETYKNPDIGHIRGLTWDGSHLWAAEDYFGEPAGYYFTKLTRQLDVVNRIPQSYPITDAIAFDGTKFWSTQVRKLIESDISFNPIQIYDLNDVIPRSIVWKNRDLWSIDGLGFHRHIPPDFGVAETYPGISGTNIDLAYDGMNIWSLNYNMLRKHDPEMRAINEYAVSSRIPDESFSGRGLAYDGRNFYLIGTISSGEGMTLLKVRISP